MGLAVHGTRSEVTLPLTEQVGRVGDERRSYRVGRCCCGLNGGLFHIATIEKQKGKKEKK